MRTLGWLAGRVTVKNDGTFTIAVDYSPEYTNIEVDNGTWTKNKDGSLSLIGGSQDYTAEATDNGDDTITYIMEFLNAETGVTVAVSGTTKASGSSTADGVYAELTGNGIDGGEWMVGHVTLWTDGTFSVAVDYNADYANIETDSGTWTTAEDGSLILAGTARDFTAEASDNGDSTITYTMEFVNAETGVTVVVSGTAKAGGGSASADGVVVEMTGNGIGEGNEWLWKIDYEAATVVRHIYRLAFLGYGPEQIAKMLEADKILTPAHYHLKNGSKRVPTSVDPYRWASTTVAKILCRREYCGDVINLKTYSNFYKDKKRRENTVEDMIILQDVHEAIIERSFWKYIQYKQRLHKTRKVSGKQSLFSGYLRCGDCGNNLHYHFNQANPSIEYYNCSNYVGNRGTCPNTHYIRLDFLTHEVLGALQKLVQMKKNGNF